MKIFLILSSNRIQVFREWPFFLVWYIQPLPKGRELKIASHSQFFSGKPRNIQGRMVFLLGCSSETLTGWQSTPGFRSLISGICGWIQAQIHHWVAVWPWEGGLISVLSLMLLTDGPLPSLPGTQKTGPPGSFVVGWWLVLSKEMWYYYSNVWAVTCNNSCKSLQNSLVSLTQWATTFKMVATLSASAPE